MRVLPGMRVLVPADYNAAKAAHPLRRRDARAVLRPPRPRDAARGLPRGHRVRARQGQRAARGHRRHARRVRRHGRARRSPPPSASPPRASRPRSSTWRPSSRSTSRRSSRARSKTGAVVTCEEHSIIGGLGSAVAEVLGENAPVPMERIGVDDVFGTSGEPDELMGYFGLTAADIARGGRGPARALSRDLHRTNTRKPSPRDALFAKLPRWESLQRNGASL